VGDDADTFDEGGPQLGARVKWAPDGKGVVRQVSVSSTGSSRVLVDVDLASSDFTSGQSARKQKWLPLSKVRPVCRVRVSQLTQDHKPDLEGEAVRIQSLVAERGDDLDEILQLPPKPSEGGSDRTCARVCGLAVSRCLGARFAYPYVIPEPDVSEVTVVCASSNEPEDKGPGLVEVGRDNSTPQVAAGDVWAVFLCSDGIWDVLSPQEAAEIVMEPKARKEIEYDDTMLSNTVETDEDSNQQGAFMEAETEEELRYLADLVVERALSIGSGDNMTCVLLKIKWGLHREEPHDRAHRLSGSFFP